MKIRDLIFALIAVIVWGVNFTVIKLGVGEIPPMLLVSLRYIAASLPLIAFVKPPKISWKYVLAYGLTVGVGQFACLFYAIHIGMPAGVSSVVLQSQAFFTILLDAVFFKESLKASQVIGLVVSAAGLFFVNGNIGSGKASAIPTGAFFLTLLAAVFWGVSNIIARHASKQVASRGETLNMFSLVVWSSLVPPIPMLAIALLLDKPSTLLHAVSHLNALSIFSILYLAFFATLIGYGIWSSMIAKYPAGKVAPLSLLVPVVGLITALIVLKEQLSIMQWLGGVIIIMGLLITNFGYPVIKRIFQSKDVETNA